MVQKMGCLLELSSDARKYVVIEDRLMEPLRKKWKDPKGHNSNITLQTSILNVGLYIRQEVLLIITSLLT